jgi:hypothetical protein
MAFFEMSKERFWQGQSLKRVKRLKTPKTPHFSL